MAGLDVVDKLNLMPVEGEKPKDEIKLIHAEVLSKRNHVYEVSGKVPDQPLGMPLPEGRRAVPIPPLPVTRPEEKKPAAAKPAAQPLPASRKPRRRSLRSRRPKNKSTQISATMPSFSLN